MIVSDPRFREDGHALSCDIIRDKFDAVSTASQKRRRIQAPDVRASRPIDSFPGGRTSPAAALSNALTLLPRDTHVLTYLLTSARKRVAYAVNNDRSLAERSIAPRARRRRTSMLHYTPRSVTLPLDVDAYDNEVSSSELAFSIPARRAAIIFRTQYHHIIGTSHRARRDAGGRRTQRSLCYHLTGYVATRHAHRIILDVFAYTFARVSRVRDTIVIAIIHSATNCTED